MKMFRVLSLLMVIWGMSWPMACEDNGDEPCLMSGHNFLAINCLCRVVAPPTSYNEFLYADGGSFVWQEKDKDNNLLKVIDNIGDDGYEVSPQVVIPKSAKDPYINSHGTIFIKDGAGAYQEIAKIQLFRVPNVHGLTKAARQLWDITCNSGHAEPIKDNSGILMFSKVVEELVESQIDPVVQLCKIIEEQKLAYEESKTKTEDIDNDSVLIDNYRAARSQYEAMNSKCESMQTYDWKNIKCYKINEETFNEIRQLSGQIAKLMNDTSEDSVHLLEYYSIKKKELTDLVKQKTELMKKHDSPIFVMMTEYLENEKPSEPDSMHAYMKRTGSSIPRKPGQFDKSKRNNAA